MEARGLMEVQVRAVRQVHQEPMGVRVPMAVQARRVNRVQLELRGFAPRQLTSHT
jgi:hypothetical protein